MTLAGGRRGRGIRLLALVVLSTFIGVSDAAAVRIFFGPPSTAGPLMPGEQVSIEVFIDTEGATGTNVIWVSAFFDPTLLRFVYGAGPGQILAPCGELYCGIFNEEQPREYDDEPLGHMIVARYGFATPGFNVGVLSSPQERIGLMTFEAISGAGGTTTLDLLFLAHDSVEVDGVDVTNSVTLESSPAIVVSP